MHIKKILGLLLVIVTLSSCQNPLGGGSSENQARVRYANETSDFQFLYGMRLGTAQYTGSLLPGATTSYYQTEPGDYALYAKTSSGEWTQAFYGSATLSPAGSYTVTISGSYYANSMYWSISED